MLGILVISWSCGLLLFLMTQARRRDGVSCIWQREVVLAAVMEGVERGSLYRRERSSG